MQKFFFFSLLQDPKIHSSNSTPNIRINLRTKSIKIATSNTKWIKKYQKFYGVFVEPANVKLKKKDYEEYVQGTAS